MSDPSKPSGDRPVPARFRWQDVTRQNLVEEIVLSRCPDPFAVLGAHQTGEGEPAGVVVRAFHPEATSVTLVILDADGAVEEEGAMERIHPDGFFQRFTPGRD